MSPAEERTGIAKSLVIIQIEKVEDTVSSIEQQHAATIDNSRKVARQPRKFLFARYRKRINLILEFSRQRFAPANLPIRTRRQFWTFRGASRKCRGIFVHTFPNDSAIA